MWQEYLRSLVRRHFESSKQKKSALSLRGLARQLAMSPGSLSSWLSGHRSVSLKRARILMNRIAACDEERHHFESLVELDGKRPPTLEALRAHVVSGGEEVRAKMQSSLLDVEGSDNATLLSVTLPTTPAQVAWIQSEMARLLLQAFHVSSAGPVTHAYHVGFYLLPVGSGVSQDRTASEGNSVLSR